MNPLKRYRITCAWFCLLLWGGSTLGSGCQLHACRYNADCSGYLCNTVSLTCRTDCKADADCNTLQGYTCQSGKCVCSSNDTAYCRQSCYKDDDCAALAATKCVDPCESCFEAVKNAKDEETGEIKKKEGCTCLDPDLQLKLDRINEWGPKATTWKKEVESWKTKVIEWKEKGMSGDAPTLPTLAAASQEIEALIVVITWRKELQTWQEGKYKTWRELSTETWKNQAEATRNQALSEIPSPPTLTRPATPEGFPKLCKKTD